MKKEKSYYIISNEYEVKNKNLELVSDISFKEGNKRERVHFQLWNNLITKMDLKMEEHMFSEELIVKENIVVLKNNARKFFSKIEAEKYIYDEILMEEKDLKYREKIYVAILPLLNESSFNERNINIKNGYALADIIGNYKIFRIIKNNKTLNVVDEEIKSLMVGFGFKNLKFEKIV